MLQLLVSGKEVQFLLCFVEGMCVSDYLCQLCDVLYVKYMFEDDSYVMVVKVLGFEYVDWVEGWFWLDIWMYIVNISDIVIFKCVYQKMVVEVVKVWEGWMENLFYVDQNQLLIMVLIIEKEIVVVEECDCVVLVFINCLCIGMCLQIDLIVIYGMGVGYIGKLMCKDFEMLIVYNIYIISGLLLGFIVVLGEVLLKVVVYLVKMLYFYFVVDGKGGYMFIINLVSYNCVVQDYLKVFKEKNVQ